MGREMTFVDYALLMGIVLCGIVLVGLGVGWTVIHVLGLDGRRRN
jgi:hypothetical protein